jgi:uncharacterized protein (TIRG00374 family)
VNITRKNTKSAFDLGMISLRRRSYGKIFRFLIWLLIPLVLWWSLKDISVAEVFNSLRMIGLEAVLILFMLNVLIFVLFTFRWWLILKAQGHKLSITTLISYRLAGFGVTYFTPGPQFGGEPLQVYLLNQREGMRTSVAAASVTMDKLLELLANFTFLLVGVAVIIFGGVLAVSSSAGLIFIPLLLLAIPALYLIALRNRKLPISSTASKLEHRFLNASWFTPINKNLKETEDLVSKFCQENTLGLVGAAALSIGIWLLMVLEFSLMLGYLGVNLSLAQILIALTAARIAFLLPLPAGLGTLEAGQVMAMGLIGVNPVIGISLTLLIRMRDVLFGGLGLWLGGIYSK